MSLQIMTEDGAKIVAGNVGGGSLPTPTDENKMLISNSSLEWEEIDKSDISEHYTLPIASANTLGGIKIGSGLNITDDGTVSVNPNSVTIEYITSGTINPATSTGQGVQGVSTTISYQFKKTYSSPPRITGHIYPLSTYKDRAIYISEITNVTTTGCDIVVVNPYTSSWTLSERRSIRLIIEDVDGGAGVTSYTIYSTNETLIGEWLGERLYRCVIRGLSLNMNKVVPWQGFSLGINHNIKKGITCRLFRTNGDFVSEYKPLQVDVQNYNGGDYIEVKGSVTDNDILTIDTVVIEYTKSE